ncbi:hypothetical protein [Microbacterium sp. NPDC058389]|uniref:hypothetical protein n=1 Tax=Microbacterium sp. NPDC058389 TaxID=3346475 RepID=UPI00365BB5B3
MMDETPENLMFTAALESGLVPVGAAELDDGARVWLRTLADSSPVECPHPALWRVLGAADASGGPIITSECPTCALSRAQAGACCALCGAADTAGGRQDVITLGSHAVAILTRCPDCATPKDEPMTEPDTDQTVNSPKPARRGVLQRARERISLDSDERARRAQLPEAWCRYCGGIAAAGEGTVEPERPLIPPHPAGGETPERAVKVLREQWAAAQPPRAMQWTRACATCADAARRGEIAAEAFSRLAGRPVAERDARAALSMLRRWELDAAGTPLRLVGVFVFAIEREQGTGTPWGHVTDDERRQLLDTLSVAERASTPGASDDGACGLCGRREARRWHRSAEPMHAAALTWPDGSEAPLCGVCHAVWQRRGAPTDAQGIRRVVWEALTGEPIGLGSEADERVTPYCRSHAADCAGVDQAWSWAQPGLAQIHDERRELSQRGAQERAQREVEVPAHW